ncbi:MAG: ATP-binding protein, partial [Victivallales bacterium]|nr:ATP-binding protein [Victivallales bacterium]
MPKDSKHGWTVDMAAEGWRKLGMLLQVLKNGELHEGMALLWDEPEANLNPKLICLMAKAIVRLANLGIQVFLCTHHRFSRQIIHPKNHETVAPENSSFLPPSHGIPEHGIESATLSRSGRS